MMSKNHPQRKKTASKTRKKKKITPQENFLDEEEDDIEEENDIEEEDEIEEAPKKKNKFAPLKKNVVERQGMMVRSKVCNSWCYC